MLGQIRICYRRREMRNVCMTMYDADDEEAHRPSKII